MLKLQIFLYWISITSVAECAPGYTAGRKQNAGKFTFWSRVLYCIEFLQAYTANREYLKISSLVLNYCQHFISYKKQIPAIKFRVNFTIIGRKRNLMKYLCSNDCQHFNFWCWNNVDLIKQLIQAENNKALQLNFVSYSRWWGEKKYWRNTFVRIYTGLYG